MPELCFACNAPAEDEYHWFESVPALGCEYEVVWELCEKCCEFAVDVVELVSNLDDEVEREVERWQR